MADQNGSPPSAAASVTMPTAPWMTAPTASTAPVAASSDTVVATPVAAPPTAPVTNPVASPAATPVAAPASAVTAPAPSAPVIAAPPPAAAPAAPTTAPARAIARPPVRPISRMAPRPSYDSLIKKPASVTPEKKTVGPFSIFLYGLPGIGKTRFAAWVFLWWMVTRPGARGLTTAPTWFAVENLLWREIKAAFFRMRLRDPRWKMLNTQLELGDKWVGYGVSSDEPQRLEGSHSETA